ncbi:MAG: hypothetical protein NC311_08670 [Muribaculaceae bacterium]|nr:hypothetical protein [Muribaculaceae bacterium]MCM1399875.1 phage capsid protein [Clostridium sp.]MCM1460639.1 hypothetical protein [Bacteroides sp.]
MGLINWFKGVIDKMFRKDAEKIFGIDTVYSAKMENAIMLWSKIVDGKPPWESEDDDIASINFAKFITSDTAKKICLDIDINVTGSARADYIAMVIQDLKKVLRDKVEDACCTGGIMFKPNGSSGTSCIDYVMPNEFIVTEKNANGDIRGCIFLDFVQKGDKFYKRLEYHRFVGDIYMISNKAFVSRGESTLGREVSLSAIDEWVDIAPEVFIENLDKPLFAYYKMPYNNTIDLNSPLGVSVFSNALKELKDLDVAWSRKSGEIEDSKHMTIMSPSVIQYANHHKQKLPRFVKGMDMDVNGETIHEHVATLLTEQRINDINSILAMISTKCGFSQGEFCLDPRTGMVTATQVEADDRETIETIKDMRDALKDTLEHLIYIINAYCSLYGYAPVGVYETSYSFGDLTYNWEEDRARHWQYVQQGKFPLWRYYVMFEGMSEDEAKELVAEAQEENNQKGLFE